MCYIRNEMLMPEGKTACCSPAWSGPVCVPVRRGNTLITPISGRLRQGKGAIQIPSLPWYMPWESTRFPECKKTAIYIGKS